MYEAQCLTKKLNDEEYDKMDREELCEKSPEFNEYYEKYPQVIDLALQLRGRIKSQGQHAGGIIISSVCLADTIPMSFIKGKFVSQWTEGMAATQLSPFGLVKFDLLGLKTMAYNVYTEQLIKESQNITIDWSDCNPQCDDPYAGYQIFPDGTKKKILLNDPKAIKMADEIKTEAVFQFDTHVAKGVLANGVTSFNDLVVYTAMARPGPLEAIPEYIARRDDPNELWKKKEDPRVVEMLKETFGILCFQEQITMFWTKFGGLTVPEAEKARKAVAKKKKEEIIKLGPRIVANMIKNGFPNDSIPQNDEGIYEGAKPYSAQGYWNRMVSFGRYAFNRSHAYAYGLIAYRSLWLKAHYPTEFWASQLTYRHPDKIPQYIGVAKSEGVKFKPLRIGYLNDKLTVDKDLNVYPSLIMIKGIGEKVAKTFTKDNGLCKNIDDFVEKYGKNKSAMERLIKLGAFDEIHPDKRKHLWIWYQYKYCSKNEKIAEIRRKIDEWYLNKYWPEGKILKEREKQIKIFKERYPKKKLLKRVREWNPKVGFKHENPTRDDVFECLNYFFADDLENEDLHKDWNIKDFLNFEKEYFGVYWSSPMILFKHSSDNTFNNAKLPDDSDKYVDGVIEKIENGTTKKGTEFINITMNDGVESNYVRLWSNSIKRLDTSLIKEGNGIRIEVEWNEQFQNFSLARGGSFRQLRKKNASP